MRREAGDIGMQEHAGDNGVDVATQDPGSIHHPLALTELDLSG